MAVLMTVKSEDMMKKLKEQNQDGTFTLTRFKAFHRNCPM